MHYSSTLWRFSFVVIDDAHFLSLSHFWADNAASSVVTVGTEIKTLEGDKCHGEHHGETAQSNESVVKFVVEFDQAQVLVGGWDRLGFRVDVEDNLFVVDDCSRVPDNDLAPDRRCRLTHQSLDVFLELQ